MDASGSSILADRIPRIVCVGCKKVLDVGHLPSFSEIKCPACGEAQRIPALLANFLLIEPLGAGGMGMVYRALDQSLGRFVALKVMKKSLGDNEEFNQQFRREAQAAAALNHPNIVQIYSFGQEKGQPYIVMELVSGGRLDKMIAGGVQLDEEQALRIHIDVARGLHAASDVGLIHGDVKPENIMFGQHGEAKVVDFGLASFAGEQQEDGQVFGTPYYIAPEKAKRKKVDFRSDIYSLGATLFHVLAGEPPFDGPTATDVVLARFDKPAPDLMEIRSDLHPETARVVARMLEADPGARYPSYPSVIADLEEALEACQSGAPKRPTQMRRASVVMPRLRPAGAGVRPIWRKVLIAAGIVLAVGAVAAGGYFSWQADQRKKAVAREQKSLRDARQKVADYANQMNNLSILIQGMVTNGVAIEGRLAALLEKSAYPEVADEAADALALVEAYLFQGIRAERIRWQAEDAREAAPNLTASAEVWALAKRLEGLNEELITLYNSAIEGVPKAADEALKRANQIAAARDKEARLALEEQRRKEREIREAAAAAKRAADEAKRAELERIENEKKWLQADLDAVDKARADNLSLVAERKFAEAGRAFAPVAARLKTEAAREQAKAVAESYAAMARLKAFLIKSITAQPLRGGWPFGATTKDITGASEDGLVVSMSAVPGATATLKPAWKEVSVPVILRMTGQYLNRPGALSDRDRAGYWLAAAALCYESGHEEKNFEFAEKCLEYALKADGSVREEAERLFPGLLGP
jgi:hypothetical protein